MWKNSDFNMKQFSTYYKHVLIFDINKGYTKYKYIILHSMEDIRTDYTECK